jgi:single-strand DNA-binding protein
MASYNKVVLIGNLTRDPEIKHTPKGTAICKVDIAINRVWTNEAGEKKEEVTFVAIDLFGRTAENVAQYMTKGRPLMVEGRLKLDQWEDKTSGEKRQRLGVIGEHVVFLGTASDATKGAPEAGRKAAPKQQAPASKVAGDGPYDADEDPPF